MKKLNITKEQFEKSRYFQKKYGRLEYVSESGKMFKTDKGKVLMFKEYGKKVYPAANGCTINDMGDCLIVTNKDGLNIGQCRTMIEAEVIADEAEERTRRRLGLESRKPRFVKESASKNFEKFFEELKSKFSDIDGVKIYMMDNEDGTYTITVTIRRFDDARSVWYPEDVKKIGQFIKRKSDRFGWAVEKNVEYRLGLTDFYITETESESAKDSPNRNKKTLKEILDQYKESKKFVKESYHGRVEVKASIVATGRTAEEALELLHNRLLDADAKIIDENEKPNPEIVDKYNYWFDENMGDVDFDICRDNNPNGFIQMGIKAI